MGFSFCLGEGRKQQGGEEGDDSDDNEEFNQREGANRALRGVKLNVAFHVRGAGLPIQT